MGALFHRERTGEATTVDVSLLATGMWSMGAALALSLQLDVPWAPAAEGRQPDAATRSSPTTRPRTAATWPSAACSRRSTGPKPSPSSAGRSWPTTSASPTPPRSSPTATRATSSWPPAFAERTLDEWREQLADFSGQWTMVQNTLEAAADPQIGRQRLRQRLRDGRRRPVPAGHGPRAVRRPARAGPAGTGVQRARRRHPREPRLRLGHDRGPQGPRRRGLRPRSARPPRTCARHTTDPWSRRRKFV